MDDFTDFLTVDAHALDRFNDNREATRLADSISVVRILDPEWPRDMEMRFEREEC